MVDVALSTPLTVTLRFTRLGMPRVGHKVLAEGSLRINEVTDENGEVNVALGAARFPLLFPGIRVCCDISGHHWDLSNIYVPDDTAVVLDTPPWRTYRVRVMRRTYVEGEPPVLEPVEGARVFLTAASNGPNDDGFVLDSETDAEGRVTYQSRSPHGTWTSRHVTGSIEKTPGFAMGIGGEIVYPGERVFEV